MTAHALPAEVGAGEYWRSSPSVFAFRGAASGISDQAPSAGVLFTGASVRSLDHDEGRSRSQSFLLEAADWVRVLVEEEVGRVMHGRSVSRSGVDDAGSGV